jgi:hypothetical protein
MKSKVERTFGVIKKWLTGRLARYQEINRMPTQNHDGSNWIQFFSQLKIRTSNIKMQRKTLRKTAT